MDGALKSATDRSAHYSCRDAAEWPLCDKLLLNELKTLLVSQVFSMQRRGIGNTVC